ncbi:golgin subfamily A member 6-like protein 25 [Amphiprion ocellaris]|uniref:C2 domain-containing protein n=1 Tax=Amphiprion ocellaris TaxID=80972 RepID=A0AAQ6AFF1_AMPOC|nr:golgin subfamily A member 6-like protein 25 [Amphiprion ocellaris]
MSLADQQWCPTSVQVTVLQARGLRIKGKSGTNDAYAVMQVGKEKFQTSVVEKSVAPVWKEEAAFDLPPLLHGAHGSERGTLHVHVLHRALVGPDKLLGQAVINLLQLSEDKTRSKTEWFKLLDKTGKPDKDRGEVLLDIQFMRNNMTASMFDLSAAGKSRSRLGKFKDKVRGKKKESDSGSNTLPSFTQVLTDSEDEANEGEAAASKDGKNKKHKMKSLFSPKSNLQKNMSQSMSVLPAKNSTLSSSQSSGLNVDSSEGKKKFKFKIHKRSGSSDSKDSSSGLQKQLPVEQSNLCINGSHIYCEEPPTRTSRIGSNFSLASSGHGSMEEVPENSPPSVDSLRAVRQYSPWTEEDEEVENIKEDESRREEEERMRMEEEEKVRRQQEELERLAEEEERRRVEEQKVKREEERIRREEEERERLAEEKRRLEEQERRKIEEENEKRQREEEEKIRMEEERAQEERRRRQEEEKERVRREEEHKLAEEKRRLEEEERRRIEEEERRRREEEERVRKEKEEYERLMEEKRKLEDEKKRIEAEERIRKEEEKKKRMEEERVRKEEQERKQREEEEMRRQEEEERVRKEKEEYERLMVEKRKLEEEKERIKAEEKLKKEEEERVRMEEEKMRKEEEEKRRREEQERMQREEEERIKKEELRRREEEERARKEKEEYERLMEEKRKMEDEKKRIEAEERIRKEEEERVRMEEEMRRREEDERVRKEKEEYERLVEEKRKLEEEKERIEAEEKLRKEEEERIRMEEERRRKEEEEKRRREEQERIRVEEEKRQREEEERRQEEEERVRKEKEEYQRLEEERMKEEEQRRIEEEERIRKEEQERIKMEEEKRRQEEEERARKEKEEMERLAEERRRKKEEEKRRIEEKEKVRREEEEKIRRERKEKEEARRLEKLKQDAEEQKKTENKDGQKAAGKKSKLNSSADVCSTNPFDENYSYNPFEEIPDSPPGAKEANVQQRCQSAVSSLGSKIVSADEKELVSAQREKRPAPQPPGRNQAEKPSQRERDASTRHLGQINMQNKDKEAKTVSVPPQRSVQMIAPVGRSPADSKNEESSTQSSTANGTTVAGKHSKRPAPPRPRSVEEEPKTTSTAETKQTVYGLNPFEDDEDESDAGPVCWPPAADKDAASQTKTKSSKVARAPPPPQNNATLITQNTEGGCFADDTVPDGAANKACEPQPEAVNPTLVQESPVQNTVEACVKKEGPPVAARRLQPVKPLNSVEQQSVSVVQWENKSTGTHGEAQDKAKVNDSRLKGPFSQLTQEELISLVLKQENQLSERDKKISELEQYIDNLLVRVIEEQPSILMSLNSLKKAA